MRFSVRKVLLVITASSILLFGTTRQSGAQEKSPDLRMLLNLDLFGAQPGGSPANGAEQGPSMMDQIRALNEMGYLGGRPGGQPSVLMAPGGGDGSSYEIPSSSDPGVPQL